MRKTIIFITIIFLLLCLNAKALTVTDDFGYKTVINKTPQRIVSLAPSNTEILFALGAGKRVVGVTDYCNYPPKVVEMKKKGLIESIGGYSTVNIEKVIALKPDLVFAAYGNGKEVVDVLRSYGIKVIALNPKNISDVMMDIMIIGKAVGEEKNATKLVNWMKREIEEMKEEAMRYKVKPKVVHILWNDPIWISGNNTFANDVIELAGGINAFRDIEGWRIVSYEEILAKNPDIIIVNSGSGMGGKKNILYDWVLKEFPDLKAIKSGNVYVINSDLIDRPSYRLVYAAKQIAKWVKAWEENRSEKRVQKINKTPGFEVILALIALIIAIRKR